jgi:hypothetical protein
VPALQRGRLSDEESDSECEPDSDESSDLFDDESVIGNKSTVEFVI